MSLFDVIKYKNIDLTSAEELETLPHDLLMIYWNMMCVVPETYTPYQHVSRCRALAEWHIMFSLDEEFKKALLEYKT